MIVFTGKFLIAHRALAPPPLFTISLKSKHDFIFNTFLAISFHNPNNFVILYVQYTPAGDLNFLKSGSRYGSET
jgi:hypothetical protein